MYLLYNLLTPLRKIVLVGLGCLFPLFTLALPEEPGKGATATTIVREYTPEECTALGLKPIVFDGMIYRPRHDGKHSFVQLTAPLSVTTTPPTAWKTRIKSLLQGVSKLPGNILNSTPLSSTSTSALSMSAINDSDQLPVWKSKLLPGSVMFHYIIDSLRFSPTENSMSIGLLFQLPDSTQFYFGNQRLKFSGSGGLLTTRIELLDTTQIRRLSKATGNSVNMLVQPNQTFLQLDCDGNFTLGLAGIIDFDSKVFVAVDDQGQIKTDSTASRLKAGFSVVVPGARLDAIFGISLPRFALKAFPKFVIEPGRVFIDLSEASNPDSLKFPDGYQSPFGANTLLWKGLFIERFTLYFPLNKKTTNPPNQSPPPTQNIPLKQRLSVSVANFLYDGIGQTGTVSFRALANTANQMQIGGRWKASIDTVYFDLLQNVPKRVGAVARVTVPFGTSSSAKPIRAEFSIDPENPASLTASITLADTLETPDRFMANFKLLPGTVIRIGHGQRINNGDWYFDGVFNFRATLEKKVAPNAPSSNTWGPYGIQVSRLNVRSFYPYVNFSNDKYIPTIQIIQPNNRSGLSVRISSFEIRKPIDYPDDGIEYYASGGLAIMGNSSTTASNPFSFSAAFSVIGQMEEGNGFAYRSFVAHSISVDVEMAAFTLKGTINNYNNDRVYGDGYGGSIGMNLLAAGASINLDFKVGQAPGVDSKYFYLYFGGSVGGLNIALPFAPGFALTGFSGAGYWKMRSYTPAAFQTRFTMPPSANQTSDGICYAPEESMGLGFKVGLTIANLGSNGVNLIEGQVAMEFAFNANWGPAYFKGYGALTFLKPGGPIAQLDNLRRFASTASLAGDIVSATGRVNVDNGAVDRLNNTLASLTPTLKIQGLLNMEYNFQQQSFDASIKLVLNAFGMIRGALPGDIAGEMNLHAASDGFYVKLGSQCARARILLTDFVSFDGYFQAGLSDQKLNCDAYRLNGIRFGMRFGFDTGSFDYGIASGRSYGSIERNGYLNFVGKSRSCAGISAPVGLNGYLIGGWATAQLGARFAVLGHTIVDFYAQAQMEVQGPRPIYAHAEVNVRGTIILYHFNIDVPITIGRQCVL